MKIRFAAGRHSGQADPGNRKRGRFRRIPRVERLEDRLLLSADGFEPNDHLGPLGDLATVDVDLGLTPPNPRNQLEISVTAEAFGVTRSDSDTATVTGNVLAALGIEFDPMTHEVTSVEELEFTGGTIHLSDVSFTLDYGWLLGKIEASGTGISGTLDTPDPPGTVTGGTFNTAEHLVILDHGQFNASGTGVVGGLFDPVTIDLSEQPIEATTEMTGLLDASLQGVVAETATYEVTLTLPVDFDEEVYNDGDVVVSVAVAGTLEATGQFTRIVSRTEVVGRHIFYNRSAFDGNRAAADPQDDAAIAADKAALRPGETATFANYTSYASGINGIMVDLAGLPEGAKPGAEDFRFKVGNESDPGNWATAPAPASVTLREGAGENGSDRITIIWADNAIEKEWLQVTLLATARTGLAANDEFYFGNAVGESGDSTTDAKVNVYDMLAARDNPRTFLDPAPIDFSVDFNRDRRVNAYDMLLARDNQTSFLSALKLISVPLNVEARMTNDEQGPSSFFVRHSGFAKWLYELEQTSAKPPPAQHGNRAAEAVDELLRL